MKLLKRNLQTIYYKLYLGTVEVLDDDGNETGEKNITYSDVYTVQANVSSATGNVAHEQFGLLENYDRVVLIDNTKLPISEDTIFNLDEETPTEDTVFNYRVMRISKSLNVLAIALEKVS